MITEWYNKIVSALGKTMATNVSAAGAAGDQNYYPGTGGGFVSAGGSGYTIGGGGIGVGGSATPLVYTTTTGGTTTYAYANVSVDSDLVLTRNGKYIRIGDAIESIMERLAILEPDFAKMEKYPALKQAYDAYKTIEALCNEEEGNNGGA